MLRVYAEYICDKCGAVHKSIRHDSTMNNDLFTQYYVERTIDDKVEKVELCSKTCCMQYIEESLTANCSKLVVNSNYIAIYTEDLQK